MAEGLADTLNVTPVTPSACYTDVDSALLLPPLPAQSRHENDPHSP